ncbi:MAG: hypothetical protein SNJ33_05375 [Rikenellaceae bacterium]
MENLDYPLLFSNYKQLKESAYFPDTQEQAREEILLKLESLTAFGYNTFVTGLSDIFDIFVVELLDKYREIHPEVKYIVVTHKEQHSRFGAMSKARAEALKQRADSHILITRDYHSKIFNFPNRCFIDRLQLSLCYYHPLADGGVLYV